jgi:hypothetical protein
MTFARPARRGPPVEDLDPMKIQARGGWKTIDTVLRYVRCAENLAEGFGKPFPALPGMVAGSSERDTDAPQRATGSTERDTGSEIGFTTGRTITRDALFSAGFANPVPTGRDVQTRDVTTRRATGGQRARAGDRAASA